MHIFSILVAIIQGHTSCYLSLTSDCYEIYLIASFLDYECSNVGAVGEYDSVDGVLVLVFLSSANNCSGVFRL